MPLDSAPLDALSTFAPQSGIVVTEAQNDSLIYKTREILTSMHIFPGADPVKEPRRPMRGCIASCVRAITASSCLLLLVWVLPLMAQAQSETPANAVIAAEGIAVVEKGDVGGARDRALDDALRKAVEQTVGTLVESETIVQNFALLNDSIYTRARGFIRSYKITGEKQEGPLYRVAVHAIVARDAVEEDLRALGLLIRRMRRPRVIVMITEENLLDPGWGHWLDNIGTVEMQVINALKAKEFTTMDPAAVRKSIAKEAALRAIEGDNAAARVIAQQTGAEVLIIGRALAQPAGRVGESQMSSYQASVNARALKSDTGEIIATTSRSGKAVHLNATAGGNEALRQAGSILATDLISQIAAQWAKETSGTRALAFSVSGVSKDLLDNLMSELKASVRGVVDVFLREFSGSVGRFDIEFKGDAELLSQSLQAISIAGGRLEVTATTPNKVDARFVRAKG